MKITKTKPDPVLATGKWQRKIDKLKRGQFLIVDSMNERIAAYSAAKSLGIRITSNQTLDRKYSIRLL